jgi:hypothetical protein
LERWGKSGQTLEEFAAREGVKATALKWWRWKLGGEPKQGGRRGRPVNFVEVVGPTKPGSVSADRYEVVLGNGRVVRPPPGFTDEDFTRVLEIAERGK